ncbi:MAG: alpha/beta hydrolase-fold protein, partial [Ignavibacteria bacterium]|nr:alpha/beta hydrolase-fold protein [Ignavibacteria bacterium]
PEYAGNQMNAFTNFIANELIPYIDSRYKTKRSPEFRATAGASNGGNIALWLGYQKPDVFGYVAAQSSNVISSISNGLQGSPKLNLKFYLDIGTYDISSLIPLVRGLKTILETKGYDLLYREFHEGHSWGNWRAHIDDYLKFFFPKQSTDVEKENLNSIPDFHLYQNYPNPFNPTSKIKYKISFNSDVKIKIYDTLGRELETLVDGLQEAGEYEVGFNSKNYSSGLYFYRMTAIDKSSSQKFFSETKKMVVVK